MVVRVVITGIGLVTCLGTGTGVVWRRLLDAECGISQLLDPAYSKIPSRLAGQVKRGEGEFSTDHLTLTCNTKCASRASFYALHAAHQAVEEAKLDLTSPQTQLLTGVAVGSSLVEAWRVKEAAEKFELAYNKLSPHFIPLILTNMTAGLLSIQFSAKGPNHSVATACTTGLHAVGDAFRFIRNGDARVMLCGSTEACIDPLVVAGLGRMRALSTSFNHSPLLASRPFDALRDGFVISEGACIMVLEELQHATARGASPLAEVLGYGLSSDATHVTAPSPHGDGALRCMRAALREAQVEAGQVGYVNAHATSTPLGDAAEAEAIYKLFGPQGPLVSSTKGAVGHMLGGAGSTEAAFAALALKHQTIPPTLNLTDPSTLPFPLHLVAGASCKWREGDDRRIAMTNSFGFGGTNASLCLSQFLP